MDYDFYVFCKVIATFRTGSAKGGRRLLAELKGGVPYQLGLTY